MNGWSAKDVTVPKAITGIVTDSPVSNEYAISAGGALNQVIKLSVSGVTVTGGITAKLQTAIGPDWEDSKTVAITVDDAVYIKLNVEVAGDQTYLPLLNRGRIVITTTDAGDEVTVDKVEVLQAL